MHALLRETTRDLHRAVEARLEPRFASVTRATYVDILRAFYGFYAPLDHRLRHAPAAGDLPFSLVDHAGLLERDLLAMDVPLEVRGLPRCSDVPRLETSSELAGCLYVVEGSALGGRVLARTLERRLGLRDGHSFFVRQGVETAARWRSVLGWLDRVGAAPHAREATVEAACATFRAFGRWLEQAETAR